MLAPNEIFELDWKCVRIAVILNILADSIRWLFCRDACQRHAPAV
jgi:hypothetical protein